MASKKGKKSKTRKNTGSRKSRLWLRDLLNILGGLLVGALGVWIVQGYLQGRTEKGVAEQYRSVIQEDLLILQKAADGYGAPAADEQDAPGVVRGGNLSTALYKMDAYGTLDEDLPSLDADARPLLLAFYTNLRDAELLRKLIVEQQEHPEEMPRILAREFLRALHEGTELAPQLLRALGTHQEPGGAP
jgi:hypothetical protein